MSAKILLFEGYDGSGKTTLIENFGKFLDSKGSSSLLIGRDYNDDIAILTKVITNKESNLHFSSEILIRLAREIERVKVLVKNLNQYDYIILDRSIVSALSWVKFHKEDHNKYWLITHNILEMLGDCYLIYCYLNFEDTWLRVNSRLDKPLSKKEEKGKDENQLLFDSLRQTYLDFHYPSVSKIEILTHQSREACFTQLLNEIGIQ